MCVQIPKHCLKIGEFGRDLFSLCFVTDEDDNVVLRVQLA
jgi:hypothetical protein